jgi:hypothetical protein
MKIFDLNFSQKKAIVRAYPPSMNGIIIDGDSRRTHKIDKSSN